MNIVVNSQALAAEVQLLNRIAPTKPTIPVLGNILFDASDELRLCSTNLEVSMTTTCQAHIVEHGQTTLPAARLLELLNQLPNEDVNITVDKNHVRVTSGSFKSRLQTLRADDFPTLPQVDGDIVILSSQALRLMIQRSTYAVSEKSQKYVLDGALLSFAGSVMVMVATDGKRLTINTANHTPGADLSIVIPSKTLEVLLFHCDSGDVEFSQTDRHLFFVVGKRTLTSRMLEGQFPRYDKIIPRDCDKHLQVDRMALSSALRRVGVVADENQAVYFLLTNGWLQLSSVSAEIGEADENVSAQYEGPDVKILVSGKFILDFLERASERTVTFSIKTNAGPLLLTDGQNFINVVMVMRP